MLFEYAMNCRFLLTFISEFAILRVFIQHFSVFNFFPKSVF